MSRPAESLLPKSTQLVHSAREMLEKLSPQTVAALAIGGAAVLAVVLLARRRRFPPGDLSLPFIGPRNIGSLPYVTFIEWSKRHKSDVVGFRVWPGIVNVVVCNTYQSIREILAGKDADALAGRVKSQLATLHNPEGLGIGEMDGDSWLIHRRFAKQVLHELGLGRSVLEDSIRLRLSEMLEKIEEESRPEAGSSERRAVEPEQRLMRAVSDVVCALFFGRPMSKDPMFEAVYYTFMECLQWKYKQPEYVKHFAKLLVLLPGDLWKIKKTRDDMHGAVQFMMDRLEERKKAYKPEQANDYIDFFYRRQQDTERPDDAKHFTDKQLAWLCFEFFAAGMDTTSTVLTWSVLFMAHHQDVQRKVRAEIAEKLGADRLPSYSDRTRMRYTEAVLNEVMRFCANSPMALPHRATRPIRVRDWLFPQDTLVMSNLYAAHRQPDLWPDPEHFNPEANFLRRNASSGEWESVNAEYLIPFSQGKRQCVGEMLARQELFIFFVGILQRYRIAPHPAHPLPGENEFVFHGLGRNPKPFEALFVREALD